MSKELRNLLIAIAVLIVLIIALRAMNGREDNWIKDSKGIYVKHGSPAKTPDNVIEQQNAIKCAYILHFQNKKKGTEFNSQCLGTCGNYAVDIVHFPRTNDDDKIENQCSDFLSGKVKAFIELDYEGNIVRIVD